MARKKKTYNQRMREKKMRKAAAITALIMAAIVCALWFLYQQKNDVATDEGFRQYAQEKLTETAVYEHASKRPQETIRVDGQTGIAVSADKCQYDYVNACRDAYIAEISEGLEPKGEEDFQCLVANASVCESNINTVSLLVSYTTARREKNTMVETGKGIRTWIFNKDNGKPLVWQQVFCNDYMDKVRGTLDIEGETYDDYMLAGDSLTYFFMGKDKETDKDVITPVKLLPRDYEGWERTEVMARFVDPSKPMVALTYDDGPGVKSEDRIHDVLEQHDAVATFFYSGYMIKGREDRVKRSLENECEIGSHTWNHPVLTRCDKKELKKQLNKTNKTIKKACGQGPVLFRPSYGITNETINKKAGLPVIMWDIDTQDWKSRDAKKIFKSVIKKHKKNKLDGKIILMHCIYDETAEATEKLVPWLEAHGYQMVTVSELMKYGKGIDMKPGKVYP